MNVERKFTVAAVVLGAVLIVALIGAAINVSLKTEAETGQACVTAGGEWVRDSGYYECRQPA